MSPPPFRAEWEERGEMAQPPRQSLPATQSTKHEIRSTKQIQKIEARNAPNEEPHSFETLWYFGICACFEFRASCFALRVLSSRHLQFIPSHRRHRELLRPIRRQIRINRVRGQVVDDLAQFGHRPDTAQIVPIERDRAGTRGAALLLNDQRP